MEIRDILMSRKNVNIFELNKYRLPIISEGSVPALLKYKERRSNLMNRLSEIPSEVEEEPFSQKINRQMESHWNIEETLSEERVAHILCEFFRNRALELIQTSRIIFSRWVRVCTSFLT